MNPDGKDRGPSLQLSTQHSNKDTTALKTLGKVQRRRRRGRSSEGRTSRHDETTPTDRGRGRGRGKQVEPTTELTVPGETADYIHTSSACLHVRQQGERSLINFCILCCFLFFIYAKRIVV